MSTLSIADIESILAQDDQVVAAPTYGEDFYHDSEDEAEYDPKNPPKTEIVIFDLPNCKRYHILEDDYLARKKTDQQAKERTTGWTAYAAQAEAALKNHQPKEEEPKAKSTSTPSKKRKCAVNTKKSSKRQRA